MTKPFAFLARQRTLDEIALPRIVHALARGDEPQLVWRNDLGGLTFRLGERFLKWNPAAAGVACGLDETAAPAAETSPPAQTMARRWHGEREHPR